MRLLASTSFVIALGLAGCASTPDKQLELALQTDESAIAYLENLSELTPKSDMTDSAGWAALVDIAAPLFTISYDAILNEEEGPVASNLKIGLTAFPDIGLQAKEVRAWGMNADTYTALQANEPTRIADRLDIRDLTFYGLEETLSGLFDDVSEMGLSPLSDLGDIDINNDDTRAPQISKYDYLIKHTILDGLTWNGLKDVTPASENESEPELWDIVSAYSRWSLALGADAAVFDELTTQFAIENMGDDTLTQNMSMEMDIPMYGFIGFGAGDTKFAVAKDMTFDIKQTMQSEDDGFEMEFDQGATYDRYVMRDLRSSNLLGYFADRQLPPTSATDLISLGKWKLNGISERFNGNEYAYTEEANVDLSQFHWLIPTRIAFDVPNSRFNLNALSDSFGTLFASMLQDPEIASEMEGFTEGVDQVMTLLNDNGLDTLNFTGKLDLDWNPDTGTLSSFLNYNINELIGLKFDYDGSIGRYNDLLTQNEDGEFDFDQFGLALKDAFSLSNTSLEITDNEDGLENLFSLIHGIAQIMPEDAEGAAMIRNSDPKSLRSMAVGMTRMASFGVSEDFPPAVQYINTFADFLEKGGNLTFSIKPSTPMDAATLSDMDEILAEASPAEITDVFGISVTHAETAE